MAAWHLGVYFEVLCTPCLILILLAKPVQHSGHSTERPNDWTTARVMKPAVCSLDLQVDFVSAPLSLTSRRKVLQLAAVGAEAFPRPHSKCSATKPDPQRGGTTGGCLVGPARSYFGTMHTASYASVPEQDQPRIVFEALKGLLPSVWIQTPYI